MPCELCFTDFSFKILDGRLTWDSALFNDLVGDLEFNLEAQFEIFEQLLLVFIIRLSDVVGLVFSFVSDFGCVIALLESQNEA